MLVVGSGKSVSLLSENVRANADLAKTYAKVLSKILHFQSITLKQQFIDLKGISALKQWLSNFEQDSEYY